MSIQHLQQIFHKYYGKRRPENDLLTDLVMQNAAGFQFHGWTDANSGSGAAIRNQSLS